MTPSSNSERLVLLAGLVLLLVQLCEALRNGAPSLACQSLRPLHGLYRAKPASASQFFLTQSSLSYGPNESITVEIATHSNERFFRGFLVQAYDQANGKQVGKFLQTEHSQPVSCSAATHLNHADKRFVTLKWVESDEAAAAAAAAASNVARGNSSNTNEQARKQVRFRGTVVVAYGEFYTGFESSERTFAKLDFSSG